MILYLRAKIYYEQTRTNLHKAEEVYSKQIHLVKRLTQSIKESNLEHCEFFFEEINRLHNEFMGIGKGEE